MPPRRNIEASPFSRHLGVELLSAQSGHAEVRLTPTDWQTNLNNTVHGGALFTLADAAMGAAAISTLAEDEHAVTANAVIDYKAPANNDELTCHAEVVKVEQRKIFVTARIETEHQLIALAEGLFVKLKK